MVSDLFMRDWRKMSASGVEFTPEDVVRLNALACRVRLAARPDTAAHLPRAVFLDDGLVLREPAIGHEMWWERVAPFAAVKDNWYSFAVWWAFALSRDWRDLPDPLKPAKAVKAVWKFARRRLMGYTRQTLWDAVDYALFGSGWMEGESAPRPDAGDAAAVSDGEGRRSRALGFIASARALRLPISLEEAKDMTASEIAQAVDAALAADGRFDGDVRRHSALADYVRAREEVRRRAASCVANPAQDGGHGEIDAVAERAEKRGGDGEDAQPVEDCKRPGHAAADAVAVRPDENPPETPADEKHAHDRGEPVEKDLC